MSLELEAVVFSFDVLPVYEDDKYRVKCRQIMSILLDWETSHE